MSSNPANLPVLYRDDYLVCVHKPSGLLVHRSRLDAHDRRAVLQIVRRQLGRRVYPVHRLDKPTSGALVLALQPDIAAALNAAFRDRQVRKTYVAVVRGWPAESGEIDHPLRRTIEDVEGAAATPLRAARTRFRRLAGVELPVRVDRYPTSRYSLLELEPLSGRRHQLRRHLEHVSHPIVGDTTYGKSRHNRLFEERFGCRRLLLACVELEFAHPVHGGRLRLTAPLEGEFAALVRGLGWSAALPERWLADEGR